MTTGPSPEERVPPNQSLVAPGRWPVVGERASDPARGDEPWTLTIAGLVAEPRAWDLAELRAMPQTSLTLDIHCVTRWSWLDATFGGVRLADLLRTVRPLPEARFVRFVARSDRSHDTSLTLEDALGLGDGQGVLVALSVDGRPLEPIHGGPVRTITPERYFYKSLKWLERIELLAEDQLGWWEATAGYHNRADPWREERYLAPDLDRREVQRVLATRNFAGRSLRSISAAGRDLAELQAAGALLRDADFAGTILRGADFSRANLSNARFVGADLREANLRGADVEGADFRGADLRGADMRVASMFGASFAPETHDDAADSEAGDRGGAARIDTGTRFDPESLTAITLDQRAWLVSRLAHEQGGPA